jgi:hypothetical protein
MQFLLSVAILLASEGLTRSRSQPGILRPAKSSLQKRFNMAKLQHENVLFVDLLLT